MKYLEEKFNQRAGEREDEILLWLAGVQNDIVAANGRYHKNWKMKFHLRTKDDDKTLKKLIMDFSKL